MWRKRLFCSLGLAGSGGLDAAAVIGPLSSSLVDFFIVSDVGLWYTEGFRQLHGAYHLTCVRACTCALAFPRLSRVSVAVWRPFFWLRGFAFSNVRSQWESEAALWRDYDCFPRKMKRGERNGERVRAKADDDCFSLLEWLILPKEEIVRLPGFADRFLCSGKMASTILASISSFLSIFSHSFFFFFLSVHLSFGFYYVFSDNCFSLQIILNLKSFANGQIVIKSYKFLHYSPCEMKSRAQFMACDKSKIWLGVLRVEGWGCVSSWRWRSPRAQRQQLITQYML